ncbi:MAG: hypothetical protein M0C28_16430 [Candidatus Moduliflexus flocculans]|nr:hypothetical protein [Candidatus Moduliflexus flocculans]
MTSWRRDGLPSHRGGGLLARRQPRRCRLAGEHGDAPPPWLQAVVRRVADARARRVHGR